MSSEVWGLPADPGKGCLHLGVAIDADVSVIKPPASTDEPRQGDSSVRLACRISWQTVGTGNSFRALLYLAGASKLSAPDPGATSDAGTTMQDLTGGGHKRAGADLSCGPPAHP